MAEIREGFQAFYEEKGHLRVPSHGLIPPAEDVSTLFVIAGMQPFKPYFLAIKPPPSPRVVSAQKVLRAGGKDTDLEDVGRTDRHCSFFEMLGNFSFGDYFKDDAVAFAWEFVTERMKLDPERLWATVHEGDATLGLGPDEVAIAAWERVGVPPERIVRLGKDNFWQSGETGPCGPCSEIFYDRGEARGCGQDDCGPGHCDRYMEIYNLVFMQYDLRPGNELVPLPSQNIDTGLGLERTAMVIQDADSVFDTDGFRLIMDWVEQESGVAYGDSDVATKAHRVLADHARAMSFLVAEGVTPSNEGRGYICRRIIRRAVQHGQRIGLRDIYRLGGKVVEQMGDAYPELREHAAEIERVVKAEEERFGETLQRGMKVFDELSGKQSISGDDAFTLAATYGFPIELTEELAEERGQPVDVDRFRELMEGHREISRAGGEKSELQRAADFAAAAGFRTEFVGYEKTEALTQVGSLAQLENGLVLAKLRESPFYPAGGGQVTDQGYVEAEDGRRALLRDAYRIGDDQVLLLEGDLREGERVKAVVEWSARFPTMANHTATHLLQKALQEVLGDHVRQAGSAVRPDKLRFDFTHPQPLSPEERHEVERRVNAEIAAAKPVHIFETPIAEARELGAMMLFGEKYGDIVRVVEVPDYSRELCGGTHVRSTAEIGGFAITSESSVGSGARRIEAVTAADAFTLLKGRADEVEELRSELERVRREAKQRKAEAPADDALAPLLAGAKEAAGFKVVAATLSGLDADALLELSDRVKQKAAPAAVVLGSVEDGRVHLIANFDKSLEGRLDATAVIRGAAALVGGGGAPDPRRARVTRPAAVPRSRDARRRARALDCAPHAGSPAPVQPRGRSLSATAQPPSEGKVVLEDGTTIEERRSGAAAVPLDDPRLDALVEEFAERTKGGDIEAYGEAWLADAFRREVAAARLSGAPIACLVVRINHVTELDTIFGEGTSAAARAELAQRFRLSVRQKDHVGEWGPGGIVMVLPDTPYAGALCVADRLRGELERKPVSIPLASGATTVVPIAASFGAAAWGEAMADPAELAKAASLAAGS